MGELGHVNIAIRAREQGVDCVLLMRTGNWEPGLQSYTPNSVTFCCYQEKTFNLSQFTHLEIKIAFLF